MAPTMISVNATETVSQTDNTDAASANPIHNAAISQTFATGTSLSKPTSAAGPERSRRAFKRNRSYQPFGGFGEAPSPSSFQKRMLNQRPKIRIWIGSPTLSPAGAALDGEKDQRADLI